jgi:hypothetical protein
MARGASGAARIVLNRKALDEITLAAADGLFELAKAIIDDAHVPDAEPLGQGLVEGGGVIAFVGKKRVGVYATGGRSSVKKPRAAKLSPTGITVIGGWGFPARFLETGTIHNPAEPFATPSLMEHVPDAGVYVRAACIKRKVISSQRRARGDVYGASKVKA